MNGWPVQPLGLAGRRGRATLMLEDPGGERSTG
jgi:hypothetical protein